MKKFFSVIIIVYIIIMSFFLIDLEKADNTNMNIENIILRVNIPNTITAIYLETRIYDTIFEVVLFSLAVVGVNFILKNEKVHSLKKQTLISASHIYSIFLSATSITLFVYIVLYGHLSPGGGFGGGVVLASGIVLYAISANYNKTNNTLIKYKIEEISNISFLITVTIMIYTVFSGDFLREISQGQEFGTLFSGALIPLLNLLIGFKVFAGSWKMSNDFVKRRGTL
ncbi:MAG: multicomponent Na+:H+ antiporter subunit [Kosmotogales bacterium]|nr:multicomponent Na+:H+ antiporter subunit [Kosmotogales bacterium]